MKSKTAVGPMGRFGFALSMAGALIALFLTGASPVAASVGPRPAVRVVSPGAVAWGLNDYGQLGIGGGHGPGLCSGMRCSTSPVDVHRLRSRSGNKVAAISAGQFHSLALLTNSTVMAWGGNLWGQLGDGTIAKHQSPEAVAGLSGVTAVSAGYGHSLALLNNGTVMAWGLNSTGQLGDGTTTDRHTPVAVVGLTGVTAVAAGTDHSLALLNNGTVMAWGENLCGELGDGTTMQHHVPVSVAGLSGVKAISAGDRDSLVLLNNGTAMSWGDSANGQLGDGTTTGPQTCPHAGPCSTAPVTVTGLSGVAEISASSFFSLALLTDGTVMAWGWNGDGELGNGTYTGPDMCNGVFNITPLECNATPASITGLNGATSVSAGGVGLALLTAGTVMAWGRNGFGQLGDGTTTTSASPVSVVGLSGVTAVSAGSTHCLARPA